jgi:hypothetical protein
LKRDLTLFSLGLPLAIETGLDFILVAVMLYAHRPSAVIAEPGIFNLTWHNNFIADGAKASASLGGLIPDKSFNGVTEWAYGVTDWFEAGLYLPLYSISQDRGASINGGKLRALFVRPHAADHRFFYGANFEFSYNALHWEPRHFGCEMGSRRFLGSVVARSGAARHQSHHR